MFLFDEKNWVLYLKIKQLIN